MQKKVSLSQFSISEPENLCTLGLERIRRSERLRPSTTFATKHAMHSSKVNLKHTTESELVKNHQCLRKVDSLHWWRKDKKTEAVESPENDHHTSEQNRRGHVCIEVRDPDKISPYSSLLDPKSDNVEASGKTKLLFWLLLNCQTFWRLTEKVLILCKVF